MQNKRLKSLVIVGVLALGLSGCAYRSEDVMDLYAKPDIENKTIAAIMQDELNEKYNKFFIVQRLDEQSDSVESGKKIYKAKVSELKSTDEFDAYMCSDGTELKDTYSKLIYNHDIDKLVYDTIYDRSDGYTYSYHIIYEATDKKYSDKDKLEEYISESDTYIDINIDVQDTNIDSISKKLYELALAFKEEKLHFSIKVNFMNESIYMIDDNYSSLLSYDDLVDKLEQLTI